MLFCHVSPQGQGTKPPGFITAAREDNLAELDLQIQLRIKDLLPLSLSLTLYLDLYHELLWSSRFICSSELDIVIDVTRSMTRIDINL